MKKLSGALVVFLVIVIALVYLLIPNKVTLNQSVSFNTNYKGLFRTLSDAGNWRKWWPGNKQSLSYNGNTYLLQGYTATFIPINVITSQDSIHSSLLFVPLENDSLRLDWTAEVSTSYNPVKRLQVYFAASGLRHDLQALLKNITTYYTGDDKIYGVDIRRESVKDTALVFTFDSTQGYPTTEKIYSLIDILRNYISSQNALATDSPMLNIHSSDNITYLAKVAIPTNKKLPSSGNIFYKWMLPHGNILVTDVQGGILQADSAFITMDNYVHDYDLTAPAIPFYKLLTNRLQEKDSSRWKTRIYYPVMYYH